MFLRRVQGFAKEHCRVRQLRLQQTTREMSAAPVENVVVIIAGPTGVGKSDVAARICAQEKGVIISADSVQAYRGVHVGANKPSFNELKITPHLLIDVADHTENYNAAEWRQDAVFAIKSLLKKDYDMADLENPRKESILQSIKKARLEKGYTDEEPLLPVVCGGTMMYIQWLVRGRPDAMRPSDGAAQKALEIVTRYQEKGDWHGAIEYAGNMGDVFAKRVGQFSGMDWYRLRRTLEVAYTVLDEENKEEMIEKIYSGQREDGLASLGFDVRCFFLCPDDRMSHTKVIDKRCEEMVIRGLVKETAELCLSRCIPEMATRAIGYRQTLDYLHREDTSQSEEEKFESYLDDFTTATRRYAKKQMSWFRKDKDFLFVPVSLALEKSVRLESAASAITEICHLSRKAYENLCNTETSVSAQYKKANEEQGKSMKFYQSERHILKAGTPELNRVRAEAIELTNSIRSKKPRFEST